MRKHLLGEESASARPTSIGSRLCRRLFPSAKERQAVSDGGVQARTSQEKNTWPPPLEPSSDAASHLLWFGTVNNVFWNLASIYLALVVPICVCEVWGGRSLFLEHELFRMDLGRDVLLLDVVDWPLFLFDFVWGFSNGDAAWLLTAAISSMVSMGLVQGLYAEPIPINHKNETVPKILAYLRLFIISIIYIGLAAFILCSLNQSMKGDSFHAGWFSAWILSVAVALVLLMEYVDLACWLCWSDKKQPRAQPMASWSLLRMSVLLAGVGEMFGTLNLNAKPAASRKPGETLGTNDLRYNSTLDFVADTGDGYRATRGVADQLAKNSPPGRQILFGGDMVYPYPSTSEFQNRFWLPFHEAFACRQRQSNQSQSQASSRPSEHAQQGGPSSLCAAAEEVSDDQRTREGRRDSPVLATTERKQSFADHIAGEYEPERIPVFGIPGNHDFHDNCTVFQNAMRLSSTPQNVDNGDPDRLLPNVFHATQGTGTYFPVEFGTTLVFALDGAVTGDISEHQFEYFLRSLRKAEKRQYRRVIVAVHQPFWLVERDRPMLDALLRELAASKKCPLILVVAGDLHCFRSDWLTYGNSNVPILHITCGGGGAFLHFPQHYKIVEHRTKLFREATTSKKTFRAFPNHKDAFKVYFGGFAKSLWSQMYLAVGVSCFFAIIIRPIFFSTASASLWFQRTFFTLCAAWFPYFLVNMPAGLHAAKLKAQDMISSSIASPQYKCFLRLEEKGARLLRCRRAGKKKRYWISLPGEVTATLISSKNPWDEWIETPIVEQIAPAVMLDDIQQKLLDRKFILEEDLCHALKIQSFFPTRGEWQKTIDRRSGEKEQLCAAVNSLLAKFPTETATVDKSFSSYAKKHAYNFSRLRSIILVRPSLASESEESLKQILDIIGEMCCFYGVELRGKNLFDVSFFLLHLAACIRDRFHMNQRSNALERLGTLQFYRGYRQEACKIFLSINCGDEINNDAILRLLNNIGDLFIDIGRYQKALVAYEAEEQLLKKWSVDKSSDSTYDDRKQCVPMYNKGCAQRGSNNFQAALESFEEAMRHSKDLTADPFDISIKILICNSVGIALADLHRCEEALKHHYEALEVATSYGFSAKWLQAQAKTHHAIASLLEKIESNPDLLSVDDSASAGVDSAQSTPRWTDERQSEAEEKARRAHLQRCAAADSSEATLDLARASSAESRRSVQRSPAQVMDWGSSRHRRKARELEDNWDCYGPFVSLYVAGFEILVDVIPGDSEERVAAGTSLFLDPTLRDPQITPDDESRLAQLVQDILNIRVRENPEASRVLSAESPAPTSKRSSTKSSPGIDVETLLLERQISIPSVRRVPSTSKIDLERPAFATIKESMYIRDIAHIIQQHIIENCSITHVLSGSDQWEVHDKAVIPRTPGVAAACRIVSKRALVEKMRRKMPAFVKPDGWAGRYLIFLAGKEEYRPAKTWIFFGYLA